MFLVAGLGNPGPEYAGHRHNVGFRVLDVLARRLGVGFRSKFHGELAQAEARGQKVALLKPMQFMNLSGHAVSAAAKFFQIAPADVLVVHDELDLDFGVIRFKVGGGAAGHNGLRSVTDSLGTPDFARVRFGIGRPRGKGADYVLSDFAKPEREELPALLDRAADAIELALEKGIRMAMNEVNRARTGDVNKE